MKKRYAKILVIFITVMFISAFVFAARPNIIPDKAKNSFALPDNAVEVAPGVFYLGKAIDKGRIVEGYAFVKYKKGFAKPPWAGQGKDEEEKCYTFLAKGAKWRTVEDYVIDTGINGDILSSSIGKWETATGVNILGDEIMGEVDEADLVSPDNKNEVMFGDYPQEGVIAVAIVWGIFGGPPFARELVEWDMIFDVDFDWSESGETGKMDFENIATHELGHAVGLGDLYNSECSEQTMYGYATYGETKKRTLEAGDIAGIQKLYS